MTFKKLIAILLLLFCTKCSTFAQELNIKKIENPIIFADLDYSQNQTNQANKEFNALLNAPEIKDYLNESNSLSAIQPINTETSSQGILKEEVQKTELGAQKRTLKKILKGEKAPNALLFAMYSIHTSDDKDSKNGQQDLIGMQYDGKVFMYFRNSFYHATVIGGVARDIYRKQLTKNTKFDFGYKAGVMYGYHDEYPNLLGLTPAILPMLGLTHKGKGIDLYIVPDFSPTFIFNVRWELPNKKV